MKSDVVIVGGGPSGSAAAMFLIEQGIRPLIVEREAFPRYHIGESLTGAGGQALRDLGLESVMDAGPYVKKKGVRVFGQSKRGSWFVPVTGRDKDWNLFPTHTWQVRRSDFDTMMLNEAVRRGATLLRGRATRPTIDAASRVTGVNVIPEDGRSPVTISSELLLDCSGQATWLASLGDVTGPKYVGSYDKQIAIFSQVVGADRGTDMTTEGWPGNTIILYKEKFHWAWFIPIDDEVVSIGIVAPSAYFLDKKETPQEYFVREVHELHPELKRRVPEVKLCEDVHVIPNYSYQVKKFTGDGFMCIGDAHRFIDPIFSFGVTVALRESQIAAPVIARWLGSENRGDRDPFAAHRLQCEKGVDVLEDALDAFWEQPFTFALFTHHRYVPEITDLLAGRLYERQPSTAVLALRKELGRTDLREQSYLSEDVFSMPIGSRYHPERAGIWQADSPVETTEAWMERGNRK